jgi:hypothetical protein
MHVHQLRGGASRNIATVPLLLKDALAPSRSQSDGTNSMQGYTKRLSNKVPLLKKDGEAEICGASIPYKHAMSRFRSAQAETRETLARHFPGPSFMVP